MPLITSCNKLENLSNNSHVLAISVILEAKLERKKLQNVLLIVSKVLPKVKRNKLFGTSNTVYNKIDHFCFESCLVKRYANLLRYWLVGGAAFSSVKIRMCSAKTRCVFDIFSCPASNH